MSYDDNLFAVDTTGVEKMGAYEVFPAGLYPAIMVTASKKATKDGTGGFIECVYQFIDGDVSGKKFTSRLNLWNANQQTVDIAKRELKSLRAALGLSDTTSNLAEFVNKPLVLNITVKKRKDDPEKMENQLVSIDPYNGAPAVVNPAPQYAHNPQPVAPQFGNAVAPQALGYAPPGPTTGQPPNWQQPQQTQGQMPPAFQPGNGAAPWERRQ